MKILNNPAKYDVLIKWANPTTAQELRSISLFLMFYFFVVFFSFWFVGIGGFYYVLTNITIMLSTEFFISNIQCGVPVLITEARLG